MKRGKKEVYALVEVQLANFVVRVLSPDVRT
jgi:hypothetical protein